MQVPQGVQAASIRAIVTRADGTVVDYGVISRYHRSPLRRLLVALRQRLHRRREG